MKKLQSLEDFKASGLSQSFMSKLVGGAETPTGAGCKPVNTEISSTGCVSFTSDTDDGNGGGSYTSIKDIKAANCD
ncbi:MAG: hypothetical protein PHT26_14175 [Lentimicrobiaceae bacterium]|jgi:hypothetical protein|nr:hypothetical protein [Lentimicrobiaceae bacterium]